MSVTRIGQITGESQYTNEFIVPPGITSGTLPESSNTEVNTGSWSWRLKNTTMGLGFPVAGSTEVRAACFINHNGLSTAVDLFSILTAGVATRTVRVVWTQATGILDLRTEGSSRDTANIGTTVLGTTGTWHHMALTAKSGGSGYVSFYVDGTQVLNWTGTITNTFDALYASHSHGIATNAWNNYAYIDDFYCDDTNGEGDSAPAKRWFMLSLPNGAGNDSDWTPVGAASNYQCVDDTTPDGDTTHTFSNTVTDKDTYEFEDVSIPSNRSIVRVWAYTTVRKLKSTGNTIQPLAYDGSSYSSGDNLNPSMDYRQVMSKFDTQPDGSAWNNSDLNDMQFGYSAIIV